MEKLSFQELLRADEDKLRTTLRAGAEIDRSREASIETLSDALGTMLLRYNAACAPDRLRQMLADGLTAEARDALGLLKAGGAVKETAKKELSGWATLLLLLAAALAAVGLYLIGAPPLAAILCLIGAIAAAFIAGRGWFRSQQVSVRATLDPEVLWTVLRRMSETMDRKIEEGSARAQEYLRSAEAARSGAQDDPETLALFGDLLEALYAQNGDFALRQLKKLPLYLHERGIRTEDYNGGNAELFDLLPSRRPAATQRPALLREGKLLRAGRATEKTD